MTDGMIHTLSSRRPSSAAATSPKETPEQRHARRVAWGKDSGAKVAAAYRELQARTAA